MWQGVLEFQMQGTDAVRIILWKRGLRMGEDPNWICPPAVARKGHQGPRAHR